MISLKKAAMNIAPIVNSLAYQIVLIVVMLTQLFIRQELLIMLAMLMIFVYFSVQMLTQNLTKRQRILYAIIMLLNTGTVLALAWVTTFG